MHPKTVTAMISCKMIIFTSPARDSGGARYCNLFVHSLMSRDVHVHNVLTVPNVHLAPDQSRATISCQLLGVAVFAVFTKNFREFCDKKCYHLPN